jgi:hypothetical protein
VFELEAVSATPLNFLVQLSPDSTFQPAVHGRFQNSLERCSMVYECGDEFCGAKLSSKSDSIPNVCSVSKLGRQIDTERMGFFA